MRTSIAARADGFGARSIWPCGAILEVRAVEITDSGVGPPRQIASQSPAGQGMHPCCPTSSLRSLRASRSLRSQPPLGIMLRMTLPGSEWRLRHPQLPRRHREPRRGCVGHSLEPVAFASSLLPRCNAKPWKRDSPRGGRQERGPARHHSPRPYHLAEVERLPPPKPRRDQTSRDIGSRNALPVSG